MRPPWPPPTFNERRRSYRADRTWRHFDGLLFLSVVVVGAIGGVFGRYIVWPLMEALILWLNRH